MRLLVLTLRIILPDFVAQLRAGRQTIAEANQHNDTENLGGVENTELISQLLSLINDDVVELNTIMHNKYARQPEKVRAWQSASRVERAPQREKNVVTVPAGGTATLVPMAA